MKAIVWCNIGCSYCEQAKKLLKSKDIEYEAEDGNEGNGMDEWWRSLEREVGELDEEVVWHGCDVCHTQTVLTQGASLE